MFTRQRESQKGAAARRGEANLMKGGAITNIKRREKWSEGERSTYTVQSGDGKKSGTSWVVGSSVIFKCPNDSYQRSRREKKKEKSMRSQRACRSGEQEKKPPYHGRLATHRK